MKYVIDHIQQSPDIYFEELSDEIMESTGDGVSVSTIWRVLWSQNLTQKIVRVCLYQNQILMAIQITKVAKERDEMKRAEYNQQLAQKKGYMWMNHGSQDKVH